jgi:hypothetical protein
VIIGIKMISYVHKTDSIYTSYNRGGSRDSVDRGGLSCGAIFSIIDGTN